MWRTGNILRDLPRGHLRLIDKQDGDAIAHRVDASAPGALQRAFIRSQRKWLAALRNRTHKNVEQFLEDHKNIVLAETVKSFARAPLLWRGAFYILKLILMVVSVASGPDGHISGV